jgi:hypothetical protein
VAELSFELEVILVLIGSGLALIGTYVAHVLIQRRDYAKLREPLYRNLAFEAEANRDYLAGMLKKLESAEKARRPRPSFTKYIRSDLQSVAFAAAISSPANDLHRRAPLTALLRQAYSAIPVIQNMEQAVITELARDPPNGSGAYAIMFEASGAIETTRRLFAEVVDELHKVKIDWTDND